METNEPSVLSMIADLIVGRNDFFQRDFMRTLPYNMRAGVISRYMTNELVYLEMIHRIHLQNAQLQTAAATLFGLSMTNPAFTSSVVVAPTRIQINASLQNYPNTTSNCAICQEEISSNGCRIRQCGHVYHRSCIENWFSMSVRCPVCRHDIREEGPPTQTSPAASQTSSQSGARSGVPRASE